LGCLLVVFDFGRLLFSALILFPALPQILLDLI